MRDVPIAAVGCRSLPAPVLSPQRCIDGLCGAVGNARTPARFASEAYTLREHIAIVRREALARAGPKAGESR